MMNSHMMLTGDTETVKEINARSNGASLPFVERVEDRISMMNRAAQDLVEELGLPCEAKYDILAAIAMSLSSRLPTIHDFEEIARRAFEAHGDNLRSDAFWATLYTMLLPLVKSWVDASGIPSWSGQEDDITWDIVQVVIRRTFEYARKLQDHGVAIHALKRLSVTIAKNYYCDLQRRDARLVRFAQNTSESNEQLSLGRLIDPEETALEKLYQEWLFGLIARRIAKFPLKQRTALLIDIANRMHFGSKPTTLQKAFLAAGIRLQDYQQLLPADPVERSRHASLLSLAYRRVKQVFANHNGPQ